MLNFKTDFILYLLGISIACPISMRILFPDYSFPFIRNSGITTHLCNYFNLIMQISTKSILSISIKNENGKKMWSLWICPVKLSSFRFFRNFWSPGIFTHNRRESLHKMVQNTNNNIQYVWPFCEWKCHVGDKVKGQTCSGWQKGKCYSNNQSLQQYWVEKHIRAHQIFHVDGLQQQRT